MSTTLGVRLTDDEMEVVNRAAEVSAQPGDRGGVSAWVRRVILREAQQVVQSEKKEGSDVDA